MRSFLFLFFPFLCFSSFPTNELSFLSSLYNQTGGISWKWRPKYFGIKWNFEINNPNPCSTNETTWQGIQCSFTPQVCQIQECHVISLSLEAYNLEGILPDNWNDLPYLTLLDLGDNTLFGTFPTSLISPLQMKILYLDNNHLRGSLPGLTLAKMTDLLKLEISDNYFSGPIPSEIGSLSLIELLDFSRLQFDGGIPTSLGLLTRLMFLDWGACFLSGSIPSQIGGLRSITWFDMDFNTFTGKIPQEIGSLTSLVLFDLSFNFLSGTIPSVIGDLAAVTKFNLNYNYLNGSIPTSIVGNRLTGTIPPEFGNLVRLTSLDLLNNYLTQSIPSEIGELSRLLVLNLGNNLLSGSLSPSLEGLNSLSWMNLMQNHLSGIIPTEIALLRNLEYLYLSYNYFRGPLVCENTQLNNLVILNAEENYLTGPLCEMFPFNLQDLRLNDNHLIGSIPSNFGYLTELAYLHLDKNHLSGSIPLEIGNMSSLYLFGLAHNYLTHCIPSSINKMRNLEHLYLQSNSFHCGLDDLSPDDTLRLVHLDISDNILTGSVPPSLFRMTSLQNLLLTSNCMHGQFTPDICAGINLRVLAMDGLGASPYCSQSQLVSVHIDQLLSGNIPDCLWMMTNLTTISLSGNGLTGTIMELSVDSELQNLTLSHNRLTGTIPRTLQEHPFLLLDLSYNRFRGEISSLDLDSRRGKIQIILEVNRFSGVINYMSKPDNVRTEVELNILSGNMYACGDLPEVDQNFDTYICGSQDLDRSMITFGILFFVMFFVLLTVVVLVKLEISEKYCLNPQSLYLTLRNYIYASSLSSISSKYHLLFHRFIFLGIILGIFGFLLMIPLYSLKIASEEGAGEFNTHTHLYRWQWTAAFSTGHIPAGIILSAWAICIYLFVVGTTSILRNNEAEVQSQSHTEHPSPQILAVLFLDILIIGGVNACYIYSTIQELSTETQLLIKLAVSLFQYVWSEGFSRSSHVVLNISYSILKTIIIPCLATALTSTSCYQSLLIPPPKITSYYEYISCLSYVIISTNWGSRVECSSEEVVSAHSVPFRPPFQYNYICFSTILRAYLPIYIFTYCLKIIIPLFWSLFLARFIPYDDLPSFFRARVRGILWPHYWTKIEQSLEDGQTRMSVDSDQVAFHHATPEYLFKPVRAFTSTMQDLCVLLTFGLCCPALSFAILTSMIICLYHSRVMIGRFLYQRKFSLSRPLLSRASQSNHDENDLAVSSLEKSLSSINDFFPYMTWPVVWSSCIFIAFLCWDISGDSVGWKRSIWVPLTAISIPFLIWIIVTYYPSSINWFEDFLQNSGNDLFDIQRVSKFSITSTTGTEKNQERDRSSSLSKNSSRNSTNSKPSDGNQNRRSYIEMN